MPFVQVSARPVIQSDVTLGTNGVTVVNAGSGTNLNTATTHRCATGDLLLMGAYRTNQAGVPNPTLRYNSDGNFATVALSRHVHGVQGGAAGRCGAFIATGRSVPTDAPKNLYVDTTATSGAAVGDLVLRSVDLVGWGGLVGAGSVNPYNGVALQQLPTSIETLGHNSLLVGVAAGVSANLAPISATNFTLIDDEQTGTSATADVEAAFFVGVGGEVGALEQFLAEFAAAHTDLAVAMLELR